MKDRRTLEQIILDIKVKGILKCPKLILKTAKEILAKENAERVIVINEKVRERLKNQFKEHHENELKKYK